MKGKTHSKTPLLLLLVAGAKGAVGSTLAVAIAVMQKEPDVILSSLTTGDKFYCLGNPQAIRMGGWDKSDKNLLFSIKTHGIIHESIWEPFSDDLDQISIMDAPEPTLSVSDQVDQLMKDIRIFRDQYPDARPIFVNLLPACDKVNLHGCRNLDQLYSQVDPLVFPDIPYVLAAILSDVPVVNFTSNELEIPPIIHEATDRNIPICGRDGKTGQTFLKVVLASALKARCFDVNGWFSLNLLGNSDGRNLMDSQKAAGKLENKTEVLDNILGHHVRAEDGESCHKVHIDFYPPRGDAKEAWDVVDFKGLFGLPMSIRLNFQCRDSILAAPLVIDLARWMAVLQMAGRSGPVPELAFYFKKSVGEAPPLSFQDQLWALQELERECQRKITNDAGG